MREGILTDEQQKRKEASSLNQEEPNISLFGKSTFDARETPTDPIRFLSLFRFLLVDPFGFS